MHETFIHPNSGPIAFQWYHIVIRRDAQELKLYVDGLSAGSNTHTTSIIAGKQYFGVTHQKEDTKRFMKGYLDDIRIYNRALNDQEICELANKSWNGTNCVLN